MAGRAWVNLDKTGYSGRVHLVNPNRETIGDHRAYPDLDAIDDEIEAAIVLLPSNLVAGAVEQCVSRGIPAITVCTSGFSELGADGVATQQEFAAVARAGGSRVIGPNCIGILNVVDNYVSVPTYNITYDYTPGGVTMISHSGGMAVNLFNRAQGRGIGIRALVTLGNEADIGMAEMVDALVDDEKTRVITLFMERMTDGERFLAAARRAHEAGKPVVALKVGSSEVGQRSVEGHTGALAGEPDVYRGLLRQVGVLEVTELDELLNASHLLSELPKPAGRNVGVFTVSGGESSYFADRGSPRGLGFPMPSEATMEKLRGLIRFAVPGNPFDATGQIIGDPEYVRSVVEAFSTDPNFDMVALTTCTWSPHDADQLLPPIISAAEALEKPTVVCSWSARNTTERAWELLRAASVPAYETTDQGIAALAGLVRWHLDTEHVSSPERSHAEPSERPSSSGALDERRSKELLADAGVAIGEEITVADVTGIDGGLGHLGRDLVVKVVAPGLVHKTELGLVRVGVSPDDVPGVVEDLSTTARDAGIDGVEYLIAHRYRGVEMILGGTVDPSFGPAVMVGAGGILAEHQPDVRFLACPVTRPEVEEAVRGLRCWPLLEGLRGAEPDVDALIDMVMSVAEFVDRGRRWLDSLDLNPVIVTDEGAFAVDATVVVGGGP
jgi:acyl-CoA synthetase (NDP forming)